MKKALALVLAICLLSGCEEGGGRTTSELPPESTDFSQTQGSDNSTVSKDTSDKEQTGISEELSKYIDGLNNGALVFVDYTFTENPAAITDKNALGDAYDKALAALKSTNEYKNFSSGFTKSSPQAMFSRAVDDFFAAGSPEAIFKGAIKDDFDRDGIEECFALFTIAISPEENNGMWYERDFLVFVGSSGAEVVGDYYKATFDAALDYGKCAQIIVSSEGWNGNDALSHIYGVKSGKAAKLYGGRLNYEKTDCFLYSMGPQNIGDFAVFDINNGEYLAIQGKELSAAEISAMDSGKIFGDVNRAALIGGKYFVVNGSCFTYENGKFLITDKKVRGSDTPGITGDALKTLADVDYDAALASMKTPEEAKRS
ncbi:MAG: hypothetical protein K2J77_06000 [Oscillospiraceae bacterium]|nr:hypothetical protein [Oscillospiraceae bacterium]